jgi:hypothetical protein
MKALPIYRDALALAAALVDALDRRTAFPQLAERIVRGALTVLDAVTLAKAGIERQRQLQRADASLAGLRAAIELAHAVGLLPVEFALDLAARADSIGRQLGGWQRRGVTGSLQAAPAEC